jgi:hypothetical protein
MVIESQAGIIDGVRSHRSSIGLARNSSITIQKGFSQGCPVYTARIGAEKK